MTRRETLPFPQIVPFPCVCPSCGYDLTGADKLDRCPECGTAIAMGADCLAIAGVPRRAPGPLWRRLAWILIAIAFVLLSQTWPLIGFRWPWLLGLLVIACLVSASALVMTGTPVSKSTERVVFTPVGFARSVWGKDGSSLHAWVGDERIRTKRIGAVWQRLIIEQDGATLFDCGFRCRDSALGALTACIKWYARGTSPGDEALAVLTNGSVAE